MRISDWCSDVCSSDLQFFAAIQGNGIGVRGFMLARCNAWFFYCRLFCTCTRGRLFGCRLFSYRFFRDGFFSTDFVMRSVFCCRLLGRSEEHTSELQSLMRISYAVFCLKKKKTQHTQSPLLLII